MTARVGLGLSVGLVCGGVWAWRSVQRALTQVREAHPPVPPRRPVAWHTPAAKGWARAPLDHHRRERRAALARAQAHTQAS